MRQVLDRLASLGGSVIDAGCGNGVCTSALRRHRPDLQVVGTDLSPGMRPDAVADAQRLPLPDRSMDAALAMYMLHCVPDIPVAVSELARVLRSNGIAVVSTNSAEPA